MSGSILAALDIGGTKIGYAIGSDAGEIWDRGRFPTDRSTPPEELLANALARLEQLTAARGDGRPAALGVACPGPLQVPEGRFLEVPNMPRWQGFPLLDYLRDHADYPVAVMNDANAAALAEWSWGAARGARVALYLTMSTGMGAGIAIDGQPLEGAQGFAGEIGHLRLSPDGPVGFGKRGSVEGYLSGPGMVQLARAEALRFVQLGRDTELHRLESFTAETVCQLARDGDPAARSATDTVADKLGELCAILVDLFNPDVIALGTIGAAWPDLFLDRARAAMEREALPESASRVQLRPSGLDDRGNQSALAVAARLLGTVSHYG